MNLVFTLERLNFKIFYIRSKYRQTQNQHLGITGIFMQN